MYCIQGLKYEGTKSEHWFEVVNTKHRNKWVVQTLFDKEFKNKIGKYRINNMKTLIEGETLHEDYENSCGLLSRYHWFVCPHCEDFIDSRYYRIFPYDKPFNCPECNSELIIKS